MRRGGNNERRGAILRGGATLMGEGTTMRGGGNNERRGKQ